MVSDLGWLVASDVEVSLSAKLGYVSTMLYEGEPVWSGPYFGVDCTVVACVVV